MNSSDLSHNARIIVVQKLYSYYINKDSLIETIVSKTWQFAKKQYKWFKKENIDLIVDITNLDPSVVSDCIYDTYKSIN